MLIRVASPSFAYLCSFATFALDHPDLAAFGEPSPAEIYERLLAGETVRIGGGAAPVVEIAALGQAGCGR